MEYLNYINGEWVKSVSGETFESKNPANERVIGKFQKSNEEDVKVAINAAENAYENWSEMPAAKRGEILFRAADLLMKNKQKLGKLVATEMGKVLSESLGDVQEAIDVTYYMAAEGRRLFGHTTTSELRDKFCMTIRVPIGIVGCITPWNFPTAIPSWKIMPALICGNTIIFKPSSDTPLCAVEFVKILVKAGVPKGVLNLVTGPGGTVGKEIVKNKKIRGISFTGHRNTGKWILQNAGIKRIGLELGSKNGIIIMDDANLEIALDGVIWGAFGTTGQRCTAASRVIVHKKVKKKFENMLVNRVKKLKLGSGLNPGVDVGPLINKAALEKVTSYVEIGKREGAKLLIGGKPVKVKGKGYFFTPSIFTNCNIDMNICQDEIFGPVVAIIEAKNFDDAIKKINSVDYGLSSAIYTENIRYAFKAMKKIEAGLTYINSSTIGSEIHLPFGGVKQSGNAREGGIHGIDEFSEIKTIYFDYSGRLQKAQIDTS
ncbi:MAG: aldehyde dehydrogenase family protein [Nanoarchaeota archaeon]|nr:aldehyde dehydrogenase family protein [Nanoarchaeota archaeon]